MASAPIVETSLEIKIPSPFPKPSLVKRGPWLESLPLSIFIKHVEKSRDERRRCVNVNNSIRDSPAKVTYFLWWRNGCASLRWAPPKLLFPSSLSREQGNFDKDAVVLYNLYSAFYKPGAEGESKPLILHKAIVDQSSVFTSHAQKTHKLAFCTQMFISQLNVPFKHKEWIPSLRKDELKVKFLHYSVCSHCVLGPYWHLLFNIKNKDGSLKIMLPAF